ncbi:MAG: preprotein translocase subunit YajC [Thiobacillaceae bacterium]|nr:preprotein translocase subunit YajC [Thiobacillaceae bacterium]MCX7673516.1 preprotein translocase subunit YajC [Thiobacillaceae bacterium]MDW8324412.1 preprotein translocase subunit YajC [Burkholderiales bacterium]
MYIAPAHAAPAQQPDPLLSFLPLIVIFVLFWFLIIRPQMKRAKEQRKMQENLQRGDEVVTAGGQLGRVVDLKEQYVTLEIAKGVHTVYQRGAIQTVLPKGTMKELQ